MLLEKEALARVGGNQGSSLETTAAAAGAAHASEKAVVPDVVPVVAVADKAQSIIAEEASHPQTTTGVLHWLRSAFWASGGR